MRKIETFPVQSTAMQELKLVHHGKQTHDSECSINFIQMKTLTILDVTFFTDETWFHLSSYLIHKTYVCDTQRILRLYLKHPCTMRKLERGLQYSVAHCWPFILLGNRE